MDPGTARSIRSRAGERMGQGVSGGAGVEKSREFPQWETGSLRRGGVIWKAGDLWVPGVRAGRRKWKKRGS